MELENVELIQVAQNIADEKGLEKDLVFEAIESAISKAGKTKYGNNYDIRAVIDRNTGKNAITVVRGAPSSMTIDEINIDIIKQSKIFLTQLEVPLDVTLYCLKTAKKNGLINILNPAPAC